MPSNHLILCCPLPFLPSVFPSIKVFCNKLALCIRWPKYQSFSCSFSPSNEYSGLVSFRLDWFDPLVIQGTLKNLLRHHNSKAAILWCSAFFMVQLSHPHMATGKPIALTVPCFSSISTQWFIPPQFFATACYKFSHFSGGSGMCMLPHANLF